MSFSYLFTYVCFLVIVTIASFGMRTEYQYYLTKSMTSAFTERIFSDRGIYYSDVASVKDIWSFLEEIALPTLFPLVRNGTMVSTSKYVLSENYLLGLVRLRQLRVRNDSCEIHHDFRPYIFACYDEFSEESEFRQDFGLMQGTSYVERLESLVVVNPSDFSINCHVFALADFLSIIVWHYHSADELSGSSHWGRLNSYSGSGYYIDLGPTYVAAAANISVLIESFWIQRSTRVIFLDFTVYNANVNLFAIMKFVMELPATGGVWPSVEVYSVKLLRYINNWDYFILVCEIIFCIFTVYYCIEEILEIKQLKYAYLRFPWNLLDLVILFLSVACVGFNIYRVILVESMLHRLLDDPHHYPPFWMFGYWQSQFDVVVAILVFFCWIKIFKYLSFNKTMTQLATTLSKCAKDVGGFGIMFFIIFMAYAQLGYLLFSSQLHDFSRFHLSVFTLFRIILGDFDFDAMQSANRVIGPIFFVSYVFFVFFILLNMFLAIISDTYTEVKAELHEGRNQHQFVRFLAKVYGVVKNLFSCRNKQQKHKLEDVCVAVDESYGSEVRRRSTVSDANNKSRNKQMPETQRKSSHGMNEKATHQFATVAEVDRLADRIDDVCHELEQIQKVIIKKLSSTDEMLQKLVETRMKRLIE